MLHYKMTLNSNHQNDIDSIDTKKQPKEKWLLAEWGVILNLLSVILTNVQASK